MKRLFVLIFVAAALAATAQESAENSALPKGYEGIFLGMSIEDAKSALKSHGIFGYRGERDVSMLPSQAGSLIEVEGSRFVGRCWFQFREDALCSIAINFNPSEIDFFSLWTTLQQKYGEPSSVSPQKVSWEDDSVVMSVERPALVRYLDKKAFEKALEGSKSQESADEVLRSQILEGL